MKKILVIEDNEEVNENLCEILELSGYEVYSALDGKKGIELAINKLPDLILCDVMMPNLDGYGVLQILSKNEQASSIPLIFLTAKSEKQDLRKGMNLGAADYILKPFDDTDLLQSIEVRLDKTEKINRGSRSSRINDSNFDKKISELKKQWIEKYEVRSYAPGSEIYSINKTAQYVFFILKGAVRNLFTNDLNKTITLGLHGVNSIIGDHAVLGNTPYSDSSESILDTELILIPKLDFLDLLKNDATFAQLRYLSSASEINKLNKSLAEMAYGSVRRRVAVGLIKYAEVLLSSELENGVTITLSREQFAEIVGSAKETIIRTLSDFKSEGLIELNNHNIILSDVNGLAQMPQ